MASTNIIVKELEETNPMYRKFIFEEARAFLNSVVNDSGIAPKVDDDNLLFAGGQGFITGYGAALDGDYDTSAESDFETPEFSSALGLFPDVEQWQKARAARFAKTLWSMKAPGPMVYYASYGFISGLLKGLADMEDGSAQSRAQSAPSNPILSEICADAVDEAYYGFEPMVRWIAGEGIRKKSKAKRSAKQISEMVSSATLKYILSSCGGYSGYNDVSPEIAFNRALTYSEAFFAGFINACESADLPAEYDLEDVPEEFIYELGTFAEIEAFYGDDIERADVAKREVVELALEPGDDIDEDLEFFDEDDQLPAYDDAFWQIHGIGYSDGWFKGDATRRFHQENTPENRRRLERIFEDVHIENASEDFAGFVRPSDFDVEITQVSPSACQGKNLIEEFENLVVEQKSLIGALSILNAQSLVIIPEKEDLLAFGDYFDKTYGNDPTIAAAIEENWGYQGGPRILRLVEQCR